MLLLLEISNPGGGGSQCSSLPMASGASIRISTLTLILWVLRRILVERVEVILIVTHWPLGCRPGQPVDYQIIEDSSRQNLPQPGPHLPPGPTVVPLDSVVLEQRILMERKFSTLNAL